VNDLKQFAKDTGKGSFLDSLIGRRKAKIPGEKPTRTEIRRRKNRKAKKKIVKASRRRNRK